MQNSPNFLKNTRKSTPPLSQQYVRLTNIAYYQADFWLMLLSNFVASFSFWVVIEVDLNLWQRYGFIALFALAVVLVISYGKWVGVGLLSGLVGVLLGLKYYLIPLVENYGGYEGAILLVIFTTLVVFKLVHLAQAKMRLHFAADHPLSNEEKICHICSGEGVLNSYQPYLQKNFIKETCYGCSGKGIISEGDFIFRIQDLLRQCEAKRIELQSVIDQLENNHYKILQKLAVGEGVLVPEVKQRLQTSSEAHSQQLYLSQTQVSFYKASEEKMHILLYNQHVSEELIASQQQLEDFSQKNNKHHEALDFIQMQLEHEKQLSSDTDALGIEFDLNAPVMPDDYELVVKKIEEIKEKLNEL